MRKAEACLQVFALWHVVNRIGSMEGTRKVNSEPKLVSTGLIGDSAPMQLLAQEIETAAGCDLTALITGVWNRQRTGGVRSAPTKRSREHAIHIDQLWRHHRNSDGN